jgi:hypothetical protein
MCPVPNRFRDRAISLYRRATRHVLTRVAKCTDVDGGIFENVLYSNPTYMRTRYRRITENDGFLEKVATIFYFFLILYTVARPTPYSSAKLVSFLPLSSF